VLAMALGTADDGAVAPPHAATAATARYAKTRKNRFIGGNPP